MTAWQIARGEAQVIAALKLIDRQHDCRGGGVGKMLSRRKAKQRGSGRDADQIGHHGACRRQLARRPRVRRTGRGRPRFRKTLMALKLPADFRQYVRFCVPASDGTRRARRPSPPRSPIASSFDDVTQFAGIFEYRWGKRINPLDVQIGFGHPDVKRQARENCQLLGGIAPGDIQRGSASAKPEPLRFGQGLFDRTSRCGSSG